MSAETRPHLHRLADHVDIVTYLYTAVFFRDTWATAVPWRHKRITGVSKLSIVLYSETRVINSDLSSKLRNRV